MNDFHIALLWLRSLEIVIGHSPVLMLSELDLNKNRKQAPGY